MEPQLPDFGQSSREDLIAICEVIKVDHNGKTTEELRTIVQQFASIRYQEALLEQVGKPASTQSNFYSA